ncbi:MAG: PHP domain-containing protein, partial [Polyangiaceae bacterium]
MPSAYVELTARSNFSFLQAASSPEALVERAADLGYDTVAITDRDGLYGAVRAYEAAKSRGVRLVLGCEITIGTKAPFFQLTVLVENHAGYTNLCRILTLSHAPWQKGKPRESEPGRPRNVYAGIDLRDVCAHAEGLWALIHLDARREDEIGPEVSDDDRVRLVKSAFGDRASIAMHRHLVGDDRERARRALDLEKKYDVPIVATNLVRFASPDDKPMHDVVHCIREGITLDKAGRALAPNAEACLKSEDDMKRLFLRLPRALE